MAAPAFVCPRTMYDREIPRPIRDLLHEIKEIICASVGRFVPREYWPVVAEAITNSTDKLRFGRGAVEIIEGGARWLPPSGWIPPGTRIPWPPWMQFTALDMTIAFGRSGLAIDEEEVVAWATQLVAQLRQRFRSTFGPFVWFGVDGETLAPIQLNATLNRVPPTRTDAAPHLLP